MATKQATPKIDLKKRYRSLYHPSAKNVEVVDVPELQFLMVNGEIEAGLGPEQSETFQEDMGAIYGAAYGLKFMSKLRPEDPIDFTVMALEGLWTTKSGRFEFGNTDDPWVYTLLMMQPDHITAEMFRQVVEEAGERRPNPSLEKLRLERWREGPSIQVMHIGPYSEEPATIRRMDDFAEEHGYRLHGRHHEIYLGDPRRAKPENLKTILRHPIVTN
ncbi:MAG: GyrI-like domain-containing protein [Acidimicrobiia bacterium]|jgi:hypothetical protein